MPNINTKRPPFPIFHILFIVAAVGIIYWAINTVLGVLSYGCGRHGPALMLERFSEQSDSSKRYFANIRKMIQDANKRVEAIRGTIARIKERYNGLREEICLVTNQVDDGLRGNYASNVPEDEYSLPKAEQDLRVAKRKEKSEKYVKDLKDRFSQGYNNIKLIECFEDSGISEGEMAELNQLRDTVMEELNDFDSNLQQAEAEFIQARGDLSQEQMGKYYATLAYNDKYIKQMQKMAAAAFAREGFTSAEEGTEVLNFIPPKEPPKDINMEPHIRLPKLIERINNLETETALVDKALQIYHNTIKKQKNELGMAKRVVSDEKEQRRQMDKQAGTIKPS